MKDLNNKVWLITGCSTGFGRQIAKATLAAGYKVAVAARKTKDVVDIVNEYPERALVVQLDVTKPGEIASAVLNQNMMRPYIITHMGICRWKN